MRDFIDIVKYGFFIVGGIIFVGAVQLIALALEGRVNIVLQILK